VGQRYLNRYEKSIFSLKNSISVYEPVSVAARSKADVHGRSPAAILGSNRGHGRLLCVLSDRGLCDKLITRSEESYRLWRVIVCD
jgi:hypothetical protein